MTAGATPHAPPAARFRYASAVFLLLVLGLLVHFLLPRLSEIGDSLALLRKMSWWTLALALVAQSLSYVANGFVLRTAVRLSDEEIGVGRATAIVMAASTVALVAGGAIGYGAAIQRWTRRSVKRSRTSLLAATLPPVFDGAALLMFALASAVELLRTSRLPPATERALAIVFAIIVLIIAIVTFALIAPRRLAALLRRLGLRGGRSKQLIETVKAVSRNIRRGKAKGAAAAALLNLLFDVLTLELVFVSTGHPVSGRALIAGYGVPLLLGRWSFLPGGIAVVEVGMIATYVSLGLPAPVAVVAILTYRLISFWLPTLAGIPTALYLQSAA